MMFYQVHAGIPIIAAATGGIPLQVEHGKSGFLTTPGPAGNEAVSKHLFELFTDEGLYRKMSQYAKTHVSDEVGTVGNAAAWLYLAVMYCRGVKLRPNVSFPCSIDAIEADAKQGAWLNDMLRAETNEPYGKDEPRLPRTPLNMQG
jgi:hypothetical protein